MDKLILVVGVCAFALLEPLPAATPRGCPASTALGTFQLTVQPASKGEPRPARLVNVLEKGQKLIYSPVDLPAESNKKAKISLVLVPSDKNAKLAVMDPEPANAKATWTTPYRVSAIGLVLGPQGLDHKKVETLVTKDRELMSQLADYAEQSAQVETLVNTLAQAEQGPGSHNLDAALTGFAARYGTAMPKLDRTASTDQQAAVLVQTLNPALGAYDPLAPDSSTRMQQSMGLAASVASLFFGSNVGLAAGGAAMVQNFRTLLFPGTDFRSALAQSAPSNGFTLCAKRENVKSRTRLAYLWAYRVPDAGPPSLAFSAPVHLPVGIKSAVPFQAKQVSRARDWTLVSDQGTALPVPVTAAADGRSIELDLKGVNATPGVYHLAAKWDWDPLPVAGEVHLHALDDLKTAALTPQSRDALVEGAGLVPVKLTGPDFQFVEKLTFDRMPVDFKLPAGPRAGPQQTLDLLVDASALKAGTHHLALMQPNGTAAEVAVRVLPPNPVISNTPLRANLGEERQRLVLRGSGLGRIERIDATGAEVELGELARDGVSREAFIKLGTEAKKGDRIPVALKVEGRESPLPVANAVEVAGPRPRIAALSVSVAEDLGVALREGELPAGPFASVSMRLENADTQPVVHVACAESERTLEAQTLRAGEKRAAARVDSAGPDTLFLSLDAGSIGRAGCTLNTTVTTEAAGTSDARTLGHVVRLPRISGFSLTDEKIGDTAYAGILTGFDLETISRAGWAPNTGLPVDAMPKPVAGERDRQTLRVALPWPPPAPHAPVYIWLRGETEGRITHAKD
ncbi:MAG TPA: hypothetical protein VHA11_08100 [Bryobacteraceae bacterium]|nr:hypothetical protein [Bryobacteraceae bacterium]